MLTSTHRSLACHATILHTSKFMHATDSSVPSPKDAPGKVGARAEGALIFCYSVILFCLRLNFLLFCSVLD